MSRRLRRTMVVVAALAIGVVLVDGAAARGGGGRGGGGGGGGRGGGGAAARGSFGQNRPAGGTVHNAYNARGPAAGGDFGDRERWELRHERREERRQNRDDVPVIWEDYDDYYVDDGYDSHDDDAAYDEGQYDEGDNGEANYDEGGYDAGNYDGEVYDELPCQAAVVAMNDTAYYVCDGVWYTRAYSDGELVYVEVPPPSQ